MRIVKKLTVESNRFQPVQGMLFDLSIHVQSKMLFCALDNLVGIESVVGRAHHDERKHESPCVDQRECR